MKRRRDMADTADSRRSQPTPEEEGTEEMVFNWTDEMVSRLLDEISKIRTKHGRYRVLSGTAGFDKKGTCWKELLLSLRTYGEFQGQVLTMKELADRVVQLESLADQVVDVNGEPPAEDDVPLHKALYKAFRASMLHPPGMFNVPSFRPAVRRNVRPKLVQCSDEATSAYAGTSAMNATIPSCTVEDFCALLDPYKNALTPRQFAWVYNFGNMEDIMEHSRGLDSRRISQLPYQYR